MSQTNDQAAIQYALDLLQNGLSPDLSYHNLWHTQHDVMPATVRLARLSQVPDEDIRLLQVAAAYHDVGFIESPTGHEAISVRIAARVLPGFGYSGEQIERITNLILVTRLPQSPANLLEEILADSDLDVLGREDFFERSESLRQEMARRGQPVDRMAWSEQQLGFLQGHRYFTPAARGLREAGKLKNITLLETKLRR